MLARTDAALVARLRDLLAADAELADSATEPVIPALRVLQEADWEGRCIGDWQIGERLGIGGMGAVYRARRKQAPDDTVALKLLRTDRDDPHLRRRFAVERKLLRRLQHPGIARLIDAGETASRQPYVIIEYVEGTHLLAYADRERLDIERRVALVLDVCHAVAHAHARHVIHRDITSSNILVTADGRTKLLDFGIAKLLPSPHHDVTAQHTSTAQRFFSPASAAPEQITGGSIGRSCDVYALGALLYELLCGEVPIPLKGFLLARPNSRSHSRFRDCRRTSRGAAGARRERARTPAWLCRPARTGRTDARQSRLVTAKALQKLPRRRYPTVERLAFECVPRCCGADAPAATLADRVAATLASHPRVAAGLALVGSALVPLAWMLRRAARGVESRSRVRFAYRKSVNLTPFRLVLPVFPTRRDTLVAILRNLRRSAVSKRGSRRHHPPRIDRRIRIAPMTATLTDDSVGTPPRSRAGPSCAG